MVQIPPCRRIVFRTRALVVALLLVVGGPETRGAAPQNEAAQEKGPGKVASTRGKKRTRMRAALSHALSEDKQAGPKMLAFFLGGSDEFLSVPLDHLSRAYALELTWLELLQMEHKDDQWERILDRKRWLRKAGLMQCPEKVEPLDPTSIDRLWTPVRLNARIEDLGSRDASKLSTAIRELRIFDRLGRLPYASEAGLGMAIEVASYTALDSGKKEHRTQLLRLMEERASHRRALNPFVWKAAKDESPELRAQALLTGLRFSGTGRSRSQEAVDRDKKDQQSWNTLLLSSLEDPEPRVARSAFIALDRQRLDSTGLKKIAVYALGILRKALLHPSDPRLLYVCLRVLSKHPYGDDNLSAEQWWKLLSPLVELREPALRYVMPGFIMHRLPKSTQARTILTLLAKDEVLGVRTRALNAIRKLARSPRDLTWLRQFLAEEDPMLRLILASMLFAASERKLDPKDSVVLLRWIRQDIQRNKDPWNSLAPAYFDWMAASTELPGPWRTLLLSLAKAKKGHLRRSARETLAAHGLLSDPEIEELRASLPKADETAQFYIRRVLHLQALKQGRHKDANRWLETRLQTEELRPFDLCAFLRKGRPTEALKKAIVDILAENLSNYWTGLTEEQWRICASLGKAWKPHR